MKKFICVSCGKYWYSSHDDSEPCQRCMGKLLEVPMDRVDLELVKTELEATK